MASRYHRDLLMARWFFRCITLISLLLCMGVCGLWLLRPQTPSVGDGWVIRGTRYTLSLSPDAVSLLGPPPVIRDKQKQVDALARLFEASGGVLHYHGTTGAMGFGDVVYFVDPPSATDASPSALTLMQSPVDFTVDDACVPFLLRALEDERYFLLAYSLLFEVDSATTSSLSELQNLFDLRNTMEEIRERPGVWTGRHKTLPVEVTEIRPRKSAGSWGDEIWATVTASTSPDQRAAILQAWHRRFDVPLWTVSYVSVVMASLILPAAAIAMKLIQHRRQKRRISATRCVTCNYDLRGSSGRCPECGTTVPNLS